MRTSFLAAAAALFSAGAVSAQYTNQSLPFSLVLLSDNSTYNGTVLTACHEGAAIEGLCVGSAYDPPEPYYAQYAFNVSSYPYTGNKTIGETGYLTWELQASNINVSEPLNFQYNTLSNVAVPLFYPSDQNSIPVAFDENDLLNIQGYLDDTTVPATENTVALYRWYVCTTNAGYTYTTLAWALGKYPPENPTCVKVDVKRVFA